MIRNITYRTVTCWDGHTRYMASFLFTGLYVTYAINHFFLILSSFYLIHCTCRGLLLHLIALQDTHTYLVGLVLGRDQPVAVTSTVVNTTFLNKVR
jgi:hypothetical protein